MKAKRILLVSSAAASGLLLVAAVAAFVPRIQTWAARRAIASIVPRGATLDALSMGPNRMSLSGLRVRMEGATLYVPNAEAQLGVLSAVFGRGYLVRNLIAKGWTLDLSRPGGTVSPAAPASPGAGTGKAWGARAVGAVLAAFNVPADLSLDGVDLQGTVILSDNGGRPVGKAQVTVSGGGLAAGREGRFLCKAEAVLDDAAAPVSSVAMHGVLAASMDAAGTFTRVDLRADATASGGQFPSGIRLSGAASAARASGKTVYSFELFRGAESVASVDADSPDGSREMAGSWKLDLKDTDLAPFVLGRQLPVFQVSGAGTYELNALSGNVRAAGRVVASADRLGVVSAGLAVLGRVSLTADFDVARAADSLRVDRLEANLSGAAPVVSMRALQPFEFNTVSGELKVARASGDLVGISVKGIPLSWFRGALPGLQVRGSDARGEFAMRAENGRLALRTREPLLASGVSVSAAGRPIAREVDISTFLLADYSPLGWQVQLAPLTVRSGAITMLEVEARLGRLAGLQEAVKAVGSWSASLPLLQAQPVGAALPRFAGGDASGSFEASLGTALELSLNLNLKQLELASDPAIDLPTVASEIRADLYPDGRTTFNVPLHLDYGDRSSEMVYSGTLSSRDGQRRFDAAISAASLSEVDLSAIAALMGGAARLPSPAGAPGGKGAPGPAVPTWSGSQGRLSFLVGNLSLPRIELRNVRGTLHFEPGLLSLESGMAALGDSSAVRLEGALGFDAGAARPYSLKATVSADNLESAAFFKAIDPDKPAAIEGRFGLVAHVTGSGTGLAELLDGVQGDCSISSKDGKFRALRTQSIESVKQAPSMIIDAVDTVTSLFGRKSDKTGEALVACAKDLSEIHYDQVNIAAERGAGLDIVLTEFALIAPEERITGTGRITHEDGVPVADQPLGVDLVMGVRGNLRKVLAILDMLKDGHDELGYTELNQPIHLGGTLQNIDGTQWKEMLLQAPLRKGGRLFDKLLGR